MIIRASDAQLSKYRKISIMITIIVHILLPLSALQYTAIDNKNHKNQ